ncbi:hypothetical protein BGZ99_001714 [Dissophora globulifera]|uniref:Uncharacterized protein n=1 Tax=Dissophora globulifera TaxID=979702 RepID=A0A9P6UXX2_9FUNG|nr:hypothetical protein BGZ99_001714 [Dissophora globulifera]
MKTFIALGTALATTVSAIPLIEYGSKPFSALDSSPIEKQAIGGLSNPMATVNTKTSPTNYGNLNMGTGMMPSQIVHYGTENQPDHGYISPILVSTTAKEAEFQLAKAEKAGPLVNADLDIGKLNLAKSRSVADLEDDEDPAKWMMGWDYPRRYGWRPRRYRYRYRYWY